MKSKMAIKARKRPVGRPPAAPVKPQRLSKSTAEKSVVIRRDEGAPKKPLPRPPSVLFPTTIKLPPDTKALAQAAAADAGVTMHAFMVSAVAQVAAQSEKRRAFVAEAREAAERIMRTGKAIPHEEMKAYFKARAEGKNPPMPKAVSWRK